jgi:hypothetical protein
MGMIGYYKRLAPAELDRLLKEPDRLESFLVQEEDEDRMIDIDKSWHAIHFLLTRDPKGGEEPLCHAVLGGTTIEEVEMDYGPPRYLTPEQVRDVAAALRNLPNQELCDRIDPERLREADIYPGSWDGGEEDLEYVLDWYGELVRFFRKASESGDAVILWIG